ncbi:MAG: hypothetical protein B6I23_01400 [Rickettsiaceae bacterium 4572_127]|nr:MAG: hypothetical protein B6I23_01400 [Rickettsiaceae bacterium 4572_127]
MTLKIYLFDVDGTLTPARLPIKESFLSIFEKFVEKNIVYLVSGSDYKKLCEQLPISLMNKMKGVYGSMGNEFIVKNNLKEKQEFYPEDALIRDLEELRKNTNYPHKCFSNYIEKRLGMINFSVLGRDCNHEERKRYSDWDEVNKEREKIRNKLASKYRKYEFSLGGKISIDINPKGKGKEQVVKKIRKNFKQNEIFFFGDRTKKGGNDYLLAQALIKDGNSQVFQVETYKDVENFLKKED